MYELLHHRLAISDTLERIGAVHPERLILGGAVFGTVFMTVAAFIVVLRG